MVKIEGERGNTYTVRGLSKAHGRGSRGDGLDLGGEEFDADGPCYEYSYYAYGSGVVFPVGEGGGSKLTHRVNDGENIDHENHHPSPGSRTTMHALGRVERAHDGHACEQDKPAVDGGWATAPAVDEDDG